MSPQLVKDIKSTNETSKPETPKPMMKAPVRSFSTDLRQNFTISSNSSSASASASTLKMSPRDTPKRKYFDSGDYELAKAGILSSSSVGSLHPNPELMASYSRSNSLHHLQPFIISQKASREDLNGIIVKNQAAPNTTSLYKSAFSLDDLTE